MKNHPDITYLTNTPIMKAPSLSIPRRASREERVRRSEAGPVRSRATRSSQGSCHTHKIDDDEPRTAAYSGAVYSALLPWSPGFPTGMAMYCFPSTM
jgi:hypothetical protein